MGEQFDIKKLIMSPMTPLFWVKCVMIGLGLAFLVFDGYGLYKAYFMKPEPTTVQNAGSLENYYYQPKQTFGCMRIIKK